MRVVARQQNDLAGTNHKVCSVFTFDLDVEVALNDIVIKDQVGR